MTVEPTPEPTPADSEAAKWADLAKELDGDDADGGEPEPQPEPQPEPEPEKAEDEQQDAKPELVPYQQYEKVNGALKEERELRRQATEQLQSITQLVQQMRESRQQ